MNIPLPPQNFLKPTHKSTPEKRAGSRDSLLHRSKRQNTEGVSQNESRYPLSIVCGWMKHILAIKAYISLPSN